MTRSGFALFALVPGVLLAGGASALATPPKVQMVWQFAPQIASVSPSSGSWDAKVTVVGQGFTGVTAKWTWGAGGPGQSSNALVATGGTDTQIQVYVPEVGGDLPNTLTLQLTNAKGTTTGGTYAYNRTPSLVSPNGSVISDVSHSFPVSPATGVPGDIISVPGVNLDRVTAASFGGTPSPSVNCSVSGCQVQVPSHCLGTGNVSGTAGSVTVVLSPWVSPVANGVASASTPNSFTFNCRSTPAVTGFSTGTFQCLANGVLGTCATSGTPITVKGVGFTGATSLTAPLVSQNNPTCTDTFCTFSLPAGGMPLASVVTITAPFGSASSSQTLAYVPIPQVGPSWGPQSGPAGTTVQFSGQNIKAFVTGVTFNGTPGTNLQPNPNFDGVSVTVPAGATTGPVVLVTAQPQTNGPLTPLTFTVTH